MDSNVISNQHDKIKFQSSISVLLFSNKSSLLVNHAEDKQLIAKTISPAVYLGPTVNWFLLVTWPRVTLRTSGFYLLFTCLLLYQFNRISTAIVVVQFRLALLKLVILRTIVVCIVNSPVTWLGCFDCGISSIMLFSCSYSFFNVATEMILLCH